MNENSQGKRILIVDDEAKIRTLIRKYAEFDGYEVEEAADGMEALEKLKNGRFDIAVMDIMMPDLDGFSVCREMKKFTDVPVLMLSARGEEYDRIHGFELGVDDYVVKPFSPRELMMRINVIINRRSPAGDVQHERAEFDGLVIDFAAHIVYVDGRPVDMSPKVYDLLTYLVRNQGVGLTREQLISNVWGYDFYGDDRTLDTHIKLLRLALGKYRDHVVTIRGYGYRFDA